MKYIYFVITFGLLLIGIDAFSQTVDYTYDAAGTRLQRKMRIVPLSSKMTSEGDQDPPKAIEEIWGERVVTIFPNPSKGNLTIEIKCGETDVAYDFSLYSASGSVVKVGKISRPGFSPISFSEMSSGMYFLVLRCKDKNLTFKIIKE